MNKTQTITAEQVSILLWLKALDDFKGEGFENSSFDEKYQAFEAVEDTGFSREEYNNYVDFWINNKVIEENSDTQELSITKQGQKLFELIDAEGDKRDAEIKEVLQADLSKTPIDKVISCVKAHSQEVIGIIGLCLQGVQIIISTL